MTFLTRFRIVACIALAASVLSVSPARAETLPLIATASGQVDESTIVVTEDGRLALKQVYHVEGVSTLLGNYTHTGMTLFFLDENFQIVGADGVMRFVAADGAELSGTYSGDVTDLGGGLFLFVLDGVLSNGTERLEGVIGEGTGVVIQDFATMTFTYEIDGTWTLP